ncbi:BTAD domain-containing putative transcriptional regulator [Streptomyces sp. BE147]|uniref:AfsR/SARP family transcriptional regulator n=1 Tax=Streptomyces sp. BE147 TaxID=3002524 RepID=UPI002E776129|nr:BTAD domain-containing putative transcriptional regulator [Streptomyces sp. BE147]MEE1739722.1 BTAD domain-containing putative transcriptional regulator [Streptomyces sp. BE147]
MRFRLLGPLEVVGPGGPALITAERQRIVLAVLLLEPNRIVPMDRLVDAVWGASPPPTARAQIQICVSMVRASMAKVGLPDVIQTRSPGYLAEVGDDELDLHAFERAASAGRAAEEAGRFDEAASAFETALGLWRGSSCFGGGITSTALQAPAARLDEQRLAVVEQWVDARLALGLHQRLVARLIDLVMQNPLRERLRAQLMVALSRSGRKAEALEVYRRGRRELIDELGIEPGEELRRLQESILSGRLDGAQPVSTPPASPSVPATPAAPEAAPAPAPAASFAGPPAVPRLLPGTIADFTGRDDLLARLEAALEEATETPYALRIVSITGRGGVGKSTLAVHLGHSLANRYPDGQMFAKLRGPSAQPILPTRILERFLRSLGVRGSAMPSSIEERAELFRNLVADRRMLIVLDDAIDEEQVRWLLPGSSNCPVLITSRSRLAGLEGTSSVQVDVFSTEQALQLLSRILGTERIHSELSSALHLIKLCGNLALALRIVAARLAARPHWPLSKMVARLRDERQRLDELTHGGVGVRAGLAMAYQGLPADAQRLFRRLSMLEAAEFSSWVAAPLLDVAAAEAEDTLEFLVDAQLVDVEVVRGSRPRYRLHDLVRVYSQECLAQYESTAERSAVLGRVLSTWLFLVEEAHRRAYGGDHTLIHGNAPRLALDRSVIDRELGDPLGWFEGERTCLITAVRQAAAAGLDELCWDLALTLVTLFEMYGYFDDWRTTHEIALAATQRNDNRRGQAAMLYSLGTLHMFQYRLDEARGRLGLAGELFRQVGDVHGEALALRNLAFVDRVQGRLDEAMAGYEKALAMLSEVNDPTAEAHVLSNIAQIHLDRGLVAVGKRTMTAGLAAVERSGNRRVRAQILCRLGEAHLQIDEVAEAERVFARALETVRSVGDPVGECYALRGLAVVRSRRGSHGAAYEMLEQAMVIASRAHEHLAIGRIQLSLGEVAADRGSHERAKEHLASALDIFGRMRATKWQNQTLRLLSDVRAASDGVAPDNAAAAYARASPG